MKWSRLPNGYALTTADNKIAAVLYKAQGKWAACMVDYLGLTTSIKFHRHFKDAKPELLSRVVSKILEDS